VASYQEALKFNPFDTRTARIAEELAELYESLGNYAEAVKVWQLVAEKDPSPHSHFHLGRAYQHNQNFPEAVQHLEQAKTMLGLPG
jgi:tetratricopeptide (TPR) repeat protein